MCILYYSFYRHMYNAVCEGCKRVVSIFNLLFRNQIKNTIDHVFYGLVYLEMKSRAL